MAQALIEAPQLNPPVQDQVIASNGHSHVSCMDKLVWLKERRRQILWALLRMDGGPLSRPSNREKRKARMDALAIFDRRIAELEGLL